MPNYSYRPVDSPGYRQRSSLYQKPRRRSPRPFIALGLILVILAAGGYAVGRTFTFLSQALNFGNPLQPSQTLLFNWRDSMRFAVGGIYHFRSDTDLRAGVSYDQSSVSDAFRGADLPDSDATMFSVGATPRRICGPRVPMPMAAMFSFSFSDL